MEPVYKGFEKHTEEYADSTAVRYQNQELSYSALNAKANQLANYLIDSGVGRETPVAVFVEPGFEIAVSLLAILKAGGIYVPIDPSYPKARLNTILEDVSPKLVLTRTNLVDRLPATGKTVFCLDTAGEKLELLSADNPQVEVNLDDTAYIYFTSGTTGAPKGVMASHANLCNYIYSARDQYGFARSDLMPSVARYTFSISMFELMLPLVCGGTLILLDRDHVLDPHRMLATFQEVTFFHIGPSLLKNLVAFMRKTLDSFDCLAHVRHASSGGDMIPPELLEDLRELFSNAEVYVIYGCSEVSCMGCTYGVPDRGPITKTYVGQPFPSVGIRVLNEYGEEVPGGEVGEICFTGAGVVKGYLNKPELTAKKFVMLDGQRFYFTGDVGRLSESGDLEMLGRRDFQIQLRGMRVELAEIEFSLRRAPLVKDGVVMARESSTGDKTLVAYVVFAEQSVKHMASVRQHLADILPDYMVPGRYIELEALPLNHNMKVDRFALPDPDSVEDSRRSGITVRSPETQTELTIAQIWQRLFQIDDIGLDDNFFDLGGYSLLAMEFIFQVESELKVTLDGMDVLRETLEVLATICDHKLGIDSEKNKTAGQPENALRSEAFYFGAHEELYGLYFPAEGATSDTAVLICPPVGPEWTRTHFVVRKLIQKLVAQGIPVMRFDFYGTGDSLGDDQDANLAIWKDNIGSALTELKTRSSPRKTIGIGARLGGSLLTEVAMRQNQPLAKVILWDPVISGEQHLKELRSAQARLIKGHRPMFPLFYRHGVDRGEELAAFVYSEVALEQLGQLDLLDAISGTQLPITVLDSSGSPGTRKLLERFHGSRRPMHLVWSDTKCDWLDISALQDILPDVGFSNTFTSLVVSE